MALNVSDLITRVRAGQTAAVGRAISILADRRDGYLELTAELYRLPVTARVVGITGAPGAGKSTLVDALIGELRRADRRVGVVAVDPSSPFSGGAILGDRLRMNQHATDPDVFIRSLATRGRLGGLGPATAQAARVLGLAGFDPVIIETVGVGQAEIDIMGVADLVLMVLVPGNGDEVQCLKAGVMEIGDLFVVNKADRDGSDRLQVEVETILRMARPHEDSAERLVPTVATTGQGVAALIERMEAFVKQHEASGEAGRRRLAQNERQLRGQLRRELVERFTNYDHDRHAVKHAVHALDEGREDPVTLARQIVDDFVAWLGGTR